MYIRVGNQIINVQNMTNVEITEVEDVPLLKIHFGGDWMVKLSGEEAEKFLEALPVYEPVLEEE